MVTSYRRFLSHPGVPFLLAVEVIARLSTPMLGLALLLAAAGQTGTYATAGLVLTGHALSLAGCAPLGGRLADRHGPRRTLTAYLGAHAVAYGLLLAVQRAGPAAMIGAAVLLGATTPPVSAVIRANWPRLVPPGSLKTAYAVDNAVNEVTFILGPLLVPVLMLAMPAYGVTVTAGAALLAGGALTLLAPSVRQARPSNTPAATGSGLTRLAGPLAHHPTLTLLVLAAFGTFTFGCLRIATVAAATASGAPSSAGVLMGLLSAGALAGALGFGARDRPVSARRLLVVTSVADGAVMATATQAPNLLALAALITMAGLATGPRDALHPTLLAEHAPTRHRTEVFAWLNTFMWTGYGLGTAVAGHLSEPDTGGAAAFTAASVVALSSAIVAAVAYRPHHTPPNERETIRPVPGNDP
ncbi:MFS transporter [Streptosporangium sp. NPDC023825]|uniref:MFS transporter n=1 Tax=Streptosporangium sp. NPDC023825 TaxID=3154909 RepID=UPI0034153573